MKNGTAQVLAMFDMKGERVAGMPYCQWRDCRGMMFHITFG